MTMTYATMRGVATGGVIALLIHLYVNLATDFENGKNDPFGPYPRIPDKERLKVTFMIVMNIFQFMFDLPIR